MRRPGRGVQRGFSLIEIMVVLLVLGLGVSLVSLSVGGNETARQLSDAAETFSGVAKLAADEAILGGEPIGLTIVPAVADQPWQYYWQRYRDGLWQPADEPLDSRDLSALIELELVLENQLVDWTQLPEPQLKKRINPLTNTEEEVEELLPLVVFYPSGEATAFDLTFYNSDAPEARQLVRASLISRIDWLEGEALANLQ